MSKLKQLERTTTKRTEEVEETAPAATDSSELLAETDALLDEIDRILDTAPTETEAVDAEPETKPVTLADLMRKGSTMSKQAIGSWKTTEGETCALQATFEAAKSENLV